MRTENHTELRMLTSETIIDVTKNTKILSFIYILIINSIVKVIILVKNTHPAGCLMFFIL